MAQLMYQCHHADKGLLYLHTQGMNMTNKTSASAADPMNGIFPFWLAHRNLLYKISNIKASRALNSQQTNAPLMLGVIVVHTRLQALQLVQILDVIREL